VNTKCLKDEEMQLLNKSITKLNPVTYYHHRR